MELTLQQVWEYLGANGITTVTTLGYLTFFVLVALGNYLLPRVLRPYFLLAASYLFYAYEPANRALLPVLLGITFVTWLCGLGMGYLRAKAARIVLLVVSVGSGIGLLVHYKYWNFLADAMPHVMQHHDNLMVPLGLSYFTFAAMSYAIDVFRRKQRPVRNPLHYALFVSFFPIMITGPIERWNQFGPQLRRPRRFNYRRCAGGAFRMLWGYTKKMVLADNLSSYVSLVYANVGQMAGPHLVAATVLFAVQLYMDFSGCCDIALGAARILGFDLIENFNSPFQATSFGDFWRRWHISMTGWFRDYIYFPLGGSRCAPWRHWLNLIIVFVCSGLWHGADWRYLVWGLACGIISVLSVLTARPRAFVAQHNPLYRAAWLKNTLRRLMVWVLFCFTLVFFASALYNADPYAVYGGLTKGWQGLAGSFKMVCNLLTDSGLDGRLPVVLIFGCGAVFAAEWNGNRVADWIRQQCLPLRWTLYYLCFAAILFFAAFGQSAFIYQNY